MPDSDFRLPVTLHLESDGKAVEKTNKPQSLEPSPPTLSQREREKAVDGPQKEMILYCNNCCIKNGREGKDHKADHGPRAFFDLWYEPEEKHIAGLDENLKPGLECIVATRQREEITFSWHRFIKEKPGRIDGKRCRVFYGTRLKVSRPYSKPEAARFQPTFFNGTGNFNQWKALVR